MDSVLRGGGTKAGIVEASEESEGRPALIL